MIFNYKNIIETFKTSNGYEGPTEKNRNHKGPQTKEWLKTIGLSNEKGSS